MDEPAFLRAILNDPTDDLARLGYADWLDERGDPRGAWLRAAAAALAGPTPAPPDLGQTAGAFWQRHFAQRGGSPCLLADLLRHGGNRAVRLLSALALRDRLGAGPPPGPAGQAVVLWRAAAVAELYACG